MMSQKSKSVDAGIWIKLTKLVMGLVLLAGAMAVFQWYQPVIRQNEGMQRRIIHLRKQITEENKIAQTLQAKIGSVTTNDFTLDRLAREKLGYAKPGEKVVRFETINASLPSR
tara:strand:- start:224 stop:562 length:339 start_codon:yes stop_codon:yes gene_type:complete